MNMHMEMNKVLQVFLIIKKLSGDSVLYLRLPFCVSLSNLCIVQVKKDKVSTLGPL